MRVAEPAVWVYVAHLGVCLAAYRWGFGELYVSLSVAALLLAEVARTYLARRGR